MSLEHLGAVAFSLSFYSILGLAYFGWGKTFIFMTVPMCHDQQRTLSTLTIWIGWAFTLLIFQLIHFIFPLTLLSVSPVLLLGIALSFFSLVRQCKRRANSLPPGTFFFDRVAISSVFLLLMLSVWLASRAMLPVSHYDSGLYHLNTIRWINFFPIIPGLGNLHGRLAFNSSFFPYVAAVNLYPIFGHGQSIANSFLWLLTLLTLFEVIFPIFQERHLAGTVCLWQWAGALFCIPLLAYYALRSNGIHSPSPDLTSSLLQIVIFVIFCRSVADFTDAAATLKNNSILLFLCGTTITVKLSNAAFCGTVMLLTFIASVKNSKKIILDSMQILAPVSFLIMTFCLRGMVLSGAPFYPSTIGYVNTEWSVPFDRVIEMSNWIYSWARQPKTHWSNVLGNWNWFDLWLDRITNEVTDIVYPVGLFLALSVLNIFVYYIWKPNLKYHLYRYWLLLLPIILGISFWFITAPDPRFSNALFILLPIPALMLFASNIQKKINHDGQFILFVCALLIIGDFNLLHWALKNRWTLTHISIHSYQPIKRVLLNEKVTKSGLRVYTPVQGDQCWDSPLPCTPYFNENLRLRKTNDMSSGFTISCSIDNGLSQLLKK